ncbi:hypothetical protein [Mesorhizobium sp. ANAO-SY3R2]|uniref:hypothetical protein n=1 Tax=Mesorhizobium sp. ANAO-SY3R2 TaxID=3166644 RepID=UPI003672E456
MEVSETVAGMGHNKPPLIDVLRDQFQSRMKEVEAVAKRANELRKVDADNKPLLGDDNKPIPFIVNDEELGKVAEVAVEARKLSKQLDELRLAETEQYRTASKTTNDFFGELTGRLNTIKTTLESWATTYNDEKEASERRRLAEEARKAQEEAAKRLAEAAAATNSVEGDVVLIEAQKAEQKAEHAAAVATGSSADLVRTKTSGGTVSSTGRWTFRIDDFTKIPLEKLRPFLSVPDIERALGKYATANQDKAPIDGVTFFKTNKATFRG